MVQRRGKRTILRGATFSLGGGVTALLGPNGAGKTTLLETVVTLLPPAGGEIHVLGENLGEKQGRERARRRIGYLPQNFGYVASFSVADFVSYVAWTKGMRSAAGAKAVREVIDAVGLTDNSQTRMSKLSGGMRQRAGIAAALVHRPEFLVLDEPTVGLDPRQRSDFRKLIRNLAATTPVLLSTHLTDDVSAMCDDVLVLEEGDIVFHGTVKELAEAGSVELEGDTELERGYHAVVGRRAQDAGAGGEAR
jgi:ABC-2 type transport system ATP-binding protein